MPDVSGGAGVTAADIAANMASNAPPPVNANGAVGVSARIAREDHTHISSVFKAVKQTNASGVVTWVYPTAFDNPPVVQITIETGSGQPMVALITSNTATGGSAQVLRAQTLPANLTLLTALVSFNIFGGTVGAGTNVHVYAAKAS